MLGAEVGTPAVFRRGDWLVAPVEPGVAREMIGRLHYAGGCSNTAVAVHGLFRRDEPGRCWGVAWWLPPTRPAARSVDPDWRRVLSLSRFAVEPEVPTNAASFMLSRSVRLIRQAGRWVALVTYADLSQGHTGTIYRASNWTYVGLTEPRMRWLTPEGRQVATKATRNRTHAEMLALGYREGGRHRKHKFVLHLERRP